MMNLGKWLNDKGSNETRTYKELQKSLQSIQGMVEGLPGQCEGMAKHVTELQTLVKERATRITELKQELAKKKAEAFGYIKQVDEIISKAIGNLKNKLTSLDGLGDIMSSTGSIVNSASGIHK